MTRDFKYLIISLFTWGLGEGMFMYFQPLYLEELGASPLSIGAILGIAGVTMTVVHIPAGYLADRIGRRKLIWAGWLTGIITTGIMAAARSLAVFSIGIILYAVTLFVIAPLNSYVTAARGNLSVERAMTTTAAAFSLGAVLGPLAGGRIAGSLGLRPIYFIAFGVFIISGTLILQIKSQAPEKYLGNPSGELLKNRNFLILLPLIFMVTFTLFLPQPLAPNFLKNQRAISLQTIGILGSITSMGNVLLNLIFGYLPTQLGLVLGQIFVGIFAALIWQTTQMPLLVAAYFLYGGYRATRSLLIAQVEKMVKKANLGLAYGITETVSGLAFAAAPPLAGILYSKNPDLIFSTTLLLLIPSLLFTIFKEKNAMEYLTQLFLPISIWFQQGADWLMPIMKGITFLGNIEFYLLFMPLLYWCLDITLGIRIGIILLVSGGINAILKQGFHTPRPFWVSSGVQGLSEGTSFGFPSGHAQNAASIWGLLALSLNKRWVKILALVGIFLIGLSRVFLGVHFLHDVLAGWLVGALILYLFIRLEPGIIAWYKRSSPGRRILLLIGVTSLFVLPALLFTPPFNPPALPSAWLETAGLEINPYSYDDILTSAGAFFGLGLGIILFAEKGFFTRKGPILQLILRYLIGIAGVLLLYMGLGKVFPDDLNLISYLLRFIRYSLIGLWISFGAPLIFSWLKLTEIKKE